MNEQINLLQEVREVKKERSFFLSISLLFLLITVIIAIGMGLYVFFLKTQEVRLSSAQSQSSNNISQFKDKKIMYQTIKERLALISTLLQKKNHVTDRFLAVLQTIPQSVSISNLTMSGNTMKMTLESENLLNVNEFLEKDLAAITLDDNLNVKRVQIDSLGIQNVNGVYSVGISLEF